MQPTKVTQKQLIKELHQHDSTYHMYEYADFIAVFTDVVEKLINQDKEISLDSFGTFVPKFNKELTTYSPVLGTKVTYPGSKTMKFKVSSTLQQRIKDSAKQEQETKDVTEEIT